MIDTTVGHYDSEGSDPEVTKANLRVQSVQMAILITSMIINSTLFVHFVRKKKYKKTFHLAYLNQAGSDILLACFSTSISLPGLLKTKIIRHYDSAGVDGDITADFSKKLVVRLNHETKELILTVQSNAQTCYTSDVPEMFPNTLSLTTIVKSCMKN
jgi:hypothetical protein